MFACMALARILNTFGVWCLVKEARNQSFMPLFPACCDACQPYMHVDISVLMRTGGLNLIHHPCLPPPAPPGVHTPNSELLPFVLLGLLPYELKPAFCAGMHRLQSLNLHGCRNVVSLRSPATGGLNLIHTLVSHPPPHRGSTPPIQNFYLLSCWVCSPMS